MGGPHSLSGCMSRTSPTHPLMLAVGILGFTRFTCYFHTIPSTLPSISPPLQAVGILGCTRFTCYFHTLPSTLPSPSPPLAGRGPPGMHPLHLLLLSVTAHQKDVHGQYLRCVRHAGSAVGGRKGGSHHRGGVKKWASVEGSPFGRSLDTLPSFHTHHTSHRLPGHKVYKSDAVALVPLSPALAVSQQQDSVEEKRYRCEHVWAEFSRGKRGGHFLTTLSCKNAPSLGLCLDTRHSPPPLPFPHP